MCASRERPKLLACQKGEPAGNIRKWKSTLRDGYVIGSRREANHIYSGGTQTYRNSVRSASYGYVWHNFKTGNAPSKWSFSAVF